eukprot:scaffold196448_cov18-Tisochrysis_lutea.AAC.3
MHAPPSSLSSLYVWQPSASHALPPASHIFALGVHAPPASLQGVRPGNYLCPMHSHLPLPLNTCRLVGKYGENKWGWVSDDLNTLFPGCHRTSKQCREKWNYQLCPSARKGVSVGLGGANACPW